MEGWKEYYLKDIVDDLIMGQSPDSSSYNNEKKGIAFVQGNADMQYGFPLIRMHTTDPKRFSEQGDILLSVRAPVGDVFYNNYGNLAIGRGLSAIRINNKDLRTLVFYLLHYDKKQFERLEQGTTFTEIGKKEVRNIRVVIPQNPIEQSAIAAILSKVDEAIAAVQGSIAAAERLKKSLMQNLLTGRMKPDGTLRTEEGFYLDEKFGRVPKGWEVKKVGEIAENFDNLRKPIKSIDRDKIKGEIPYYGAAGIVDYINDYLFDGTYILFGEDGENLLSRKVPQAFIVNGKFWVNNHAHVLKVYDEYDINLIVNILESKKYDDIVYGSAQPKINKSDLNRIKIIVPKNLDEQKRISQSITKIDVEISGKQNKIAVLEKLKKSLMQNLLTGRVRVK